MLSAFEGRLHQDSRGRLTAVPLNEDESVPDGTLLVWPAGYTAVDPGDGGRVRVHDPQGQAVLEVGDRFGVGGGYLVWDKPPFTEGVNAFVMNGFPERLPDSGEAGP